MPTPTPPPTPAPWAPPPNPFAARRWTPADFQAMAPWLGPAAAIIVDDYRRGVPPTVTPSVVHAVTTLGEDGAAWAQQYLEWKTGRPVPPDPPAPRCRLDPGAAEGAANPLAAIRLQPSEMAPFHRFGHRFGAIYAWRDVLAARTPTLPGTVQHALDAVGWDGAAVAAVYNEWYANHFVPRPPKAAMAKGDDA
jgi:hypothetical protein